MSDGSANRGGGALTPGMVMIILTILCIVSVSIIAWYYLGHVFHYIQVLMVRYLVVGADALLAYTPASFANIFWSLIAITPGEEAHMRKALLAVHTFAPGHKDRSEYFSLLMATGMFLRPFFAIFLVRLIIKTRSKYIAEKYADNPSPELVRKMGEMVAPQIRQSGFHVDRINDGMFKGVARASLQPIEYAIAAGAISVERSGEKYAVCFEPGTCDEIIDYHRAPKKGWLEQQIASKAEGYQDFTGVVTVNRFDIQDLAKLKNADVVHYNEKAVLQMGCRELGPVMDFDRHDMVSNEFDKALIHGHEKERPPLKENINDMRKMIIGFLYSYYAASFSEKKKVKKELENVNRALSPRLKRCPKTKIMKPQLDGRGQWVTDYDFSKHLSFYDQAVKDPAFLREALKYKYLYPFTIALMRFANKQGNFIPSEMHFVMFYDREFWFAVHNADRPSPHPEASAALFSYDSIRSVQGILDREEALAQAPFNLRAQLEFDRWKFSGEAALQPIGMGDS